MFSFTGKDYYKDLGLQNTATPDQITRAYKVLSLKHHADKNGNVDNGMMARLTEAHEVLSDEEKKRKYDTFCSSGSQSRPGLSLVVIGGGAATSAANSMSIVVRKAVSFRDNVFAQKMSPAELINWGKKEVNIAHEIYDDEELRKYAGQLVFDLVFTHKEIAIKWLTKLNPISLKDLVKLREKHGNDILAQASAKSRALMASYDFLMTVTGDLESQRENIRRHLLVLAKENLILLEFSRQNLFIARILCKDPVFLNAIKSHLVSLCLIHQSIACLVLSIPECSKELKLVDLVLLSHEYDDSIFKNACAEVQKQWMEFSSRLGTERQSSFQAPTNTEKNPPQSQTPSGTVKKPKPQRPPDSASEAVIKEYFLQADSVEKIRMCRESYRCTQIVCSNRALWEKIHYHLSTLLVITEEMAVHILSSPDKKLLEAIFKGIYSTNDVEKSAKKYKAACLLIIRSISLKTVLTGSSLAKLVDKHGDEVLQAIAADPALGTKYKSESGVVEKRAKADKTACMVIIRSASLKEALSGRSLAQLVEKHGDDVLQAIDDDPELRKTYRAFLLFNRTMSQMGSTASLSHESPNIGVENTAEESFQMGQIFEKESKKERARRYYLIAAEQGSAAGLAAFLRLTPKPDVDSLLKIAALYANPRHSLYNEAEARVCISRLVTNPESSVCVGILASPHLFHLSRYFDKEGSALFNLAQQFPDICTFIRERDYLARLLRGRHFALLDQFNDVGPGYIRNALQAYNFLTGLIDSPVDTVVETNNLVNQIQIAGVEEPALTKLGRKFPAIAFVIYENDLVEAPQFLLAACALQKQVNKDDDLLTLFTQKLQSRRYNHLAALLYARAARTGSKSALNQLLTINRENNNKYAMLLVACFTDSKSVFCNKERASYWSAIVEGNTTSATEDITSQEETPSAEDTARFCQEFVAVLRALTLERCDKQWAELLEQFEQLQKLPKHFVKIQRRFTQALISVCIRDVITLYKGLDGVSLLFADEIAALSKVVTQNNEILAIINSLGAQREASLLESDALRAALNKVSGKLMASYNAYYNLDLSSNHNLIDPRCLYSQFEDIIELSLESLDSVLLIEQLYIKTILQTQIKQGLERVLLEGHEGPVLAKQYDSEMDNLAYEFKKF